MSSSSASSGSTRPAAARAGGCQCGGVRYECPDKPLALYACHCTECRRQSASAFGLSYENPAASLRLSRGQPRWWTRPADSGRRIRCAFCPTCGSRLWHEPEGGGPRLTVKAGSLDLPVDLATAIHIWTASRLPGLAIPTEARQDPREPPEP